MRGAGQFKAAADHCALKCGDNGHAAVFHFIKGLMPPQTDMHEVRRAAIFGVVFHKIETCAKVIAGTGEDDGAGLHPWGFVKKLDQLFDRISV